MLNMPLLGEYLTTVALVPALPKEQMKDFSFLRQ